jgi:hypothetical protein
VRERIGLFTKFDIFTKVLLSSFKLKKRTVRKRKRKRKREISMKEKEWNLCWNKAQTLIRVS